MHMKHKYQNIQVFVCFICIELIPLSRNKVITVTGNYVLTCNLHKRRIKILWFTHSVEIWGNKAN